MMKTKTPEVVLFSHTENPVECVALAVHAWTADYFPYSPHNISRQYAEELCEKAIKAYHKTALEYVDTVWVISNCSRAFQQQLTRTRLASYAIQSMRVVTKKGFATDGHYTMPPGLATEDQKLFHESMLDIENRYNKLIESGVAVEDARGILPLNIHSDITMRINLNALYHMTAQRLCLNTQWEYRQVVLQMKNEIKNKLGKIFSDQILAPCIKARKCPMESEYCGVPLWKLDSVAVNEAINNFITKEKR